MDSCDEVPGEGKDKRSGEEKGAEVVIDTPLTNAAALTHTITAEFARTLERRAIAAEQERDEWKRIADAHLRTIRATESALARRMEASVISDARIIELWCGQMGLGDAGIIRFARALLAESPYKDALRELVEMEDERGYCHRGERQCAAWEAARALVADQQEGKK